MQIVILAAGRGTRMQNLSDSVPKPMLKIKNKPILAHKIEALPNEIDEVILVIGYLGEQIKAFFGNKYAGKKIVYVVQNELNGSGAAVHLAKDILHEEFLVMMGDDLYVKEDIQKIMQHKLALLGLKVEDPKKFGIIICDENGVVKNIVEKPQIDGPAFANIGLYKLHRDFFVYPLEKIPNGEYGLPQTMVKMTDKNNIVIEKATDWFAIGTPEDLEKAEKIIERFV